MNHETLLTRADSDVDYAALLKSLDIGIDQDFHTLTRAQVEGLLDYAIVEKYRAPLKANGYGGRYYLARVQRLASKVKT